MCNKYIIIVFELKKILDIVSSKEWFLMLGGCFIVLLCIGKNICCWIVRYIVVV